MASVGNRSSHKPGADTEAPKTQAPAEQKIKNFFLPKVSVLQEPIENENPDSDSAGNTLQRQVLFYTQ